MSVKSLSFGEDVIVPAIIALLHTREAEDNVAGAKEKEPLAEDNVAGAKEKEPLIPLEEFQKLYKYSQTARSARRPPLPSLLVASSLSSLLPSSTVAAAQPQAINDSTPRLPSPLPASVDERQYCELSANLSKKCTSAGTLDGERKKQKISEIKTKIDEAESLIQKMDLEARALQPNVKVVLLAKLREYKSDLNNLKTEVKRLVSGNLNASARDELLESGMANTLTQPKPPKKPHKTAP
ncbi:hypothetical protein G4B88_025371 [Cannabis sativa]|uniref:Vesicle transport v-SNARE N-terminal domain-containing protein n=1 Tax=Cannabis sativa TaxID=3483 RepID=A0A7J6HSX5_CANSA|nr:hypothetical protein G4B88_025371 [Cannabis sativa]